MKFKISRAKHHKVWKDDNYAIDYVHEKPVTTGIVHEPQQYVYSSAIDYAEDKGLIKVDVM